MIYFQSCMVYKYGKFTCTKKVQNKVQDFRVTGQYNTKGYDTITDVI